MKHVFIVGSKGIPSNYGGFETFVEKLTELKKSEKIQYHVACMANDEKEFTHNEARCFNVNVPSIGPAKAVYYDVKALDAVYKYIVENNIEDAIVYILACRIGPFMGRFYKKFRKQGIPVYLNPDGHEWKRAKWNWAIRQYWKFSEKLMIKNTDLAICDSKAIEAYIQAEYKNYGPQTTFIAYGATVNKPEVITPEKYTEWLAKWRVETNEYYLIVGRFVAENNYELMIREFMNSKTKKSLIIVTNVEKNKFYDYLKKETNFENDPRIKFVGTIYDQDLLYQVRANAFGYLHGHEVGGTNPSLLEAMATTPVNLLLDVNFNREVGSDAAVYFNKQSENLASTIDELENMDKVQMRILEQKAKTRIQEAYEWQDIIQQYESILK